MSELPKGNTGERCKTAGTYSSEAGGKKFFAEGDFFDPCPVSGKQTRWEQVT